MKSLANLICAVPLLFCACSVPRSVPEGRIVAGQRIDPQAKVLVMGAADGQEPGEPVAVGSGDALVSALRNVLLKHGVPLSTTPSRDLPSAYAEAEKLGFQYVLKPAITQWEDNATAWSGNGDKLRISLELYSAKEKVLVGAASHYRVATGFTFVSGSPQRFMDEVSEGALNQIYGWQEAK